MHFGSLRARLAASAGVLAPGAVLALVMTGAATPPSSSKPAAQPAAGPASVDPALFKAMQWRGIGPYRGGRALAVTGVPGDPYLFYAGFVAGGVWKTTDGGATWAPLTDKTPISSIGAIAVAPSNHNIIYVGTGEAAPRGDITYGDGVYKSIDGGKTWSFVGLKDSRQIGALVVDPKNPDIVLVAALGHAFGPNAERGVFRTADGGKTWKKVLFKDNNTGAIDVTFDPHNSSIVYASLWQTRRLPWNFSSGGPGSGLYRSNDGGVTWTEVKGNGLPQGILGRIDISVSGADSKRIYAMIEARDGGLFRSDDGGAHWRKINNDGRLKQRAWYFSKIYADPKRADTVYALNTGLFRSTDGGKTFNLLPARHGDHHGLWIDPTDTSRMINASDGGASITFNGGSFWTTQDNQPTAQFYHVSVDNRFPYYVYGAQQDNSSVAIASRSDAGAIGPHDWYDVFGGESGFVLADPRDAWIVYSDAENVIGRYNKHTEQTRVISVWPIDASGHPASELEHRFNWTSPLIMSPHNPDTLYVGMERLFKTTDDGSSWRAISGDLTRDDKSKQIASGGPINKDITSVEYYDTIFAIAESPLKKGMLWVGSDDGLIHVTPDDGGTWSDVTPKDMPAWSTISMIEPSHFDANIAYAAVDRHKLDDIKPYAYKTTDAGKTWTRIDSGIPEGSFIHAVREDPQKRGLLYAATETGVFVSFDDGAHWQTLQLNLPRSPVHDLVVKGDDLAIATHGRSFWILDDVAPLRQVAAVMNAGHAFLYAPETAYRLYYPDSVDTRPPVGQNPPAGALIDYYFPSQPNGEITIDIVDANGKEVRHLTSKKTKKEEQPPEWPDQIRVTDTLPAQKGMNRFVWNLRYDDPVQIPGAFYAGLPPRGPIAMPGKYTIKFTYGGQTQMATLTLAADPRVKEPLSGLQQKFALRMETNRDLDVLHHAVNDIRAFKSEVEALHKKPGISASVLEEGDKAVAQASAIEARLIQVNMKGSEANLNYPGMLNEQIYSFSGLLEDADTAPNQQELQTYAMLHSKLAGELANWDRLKKGGVAAFRAHVKGNKAGQK